jgi:hypothetical protein
MQLGISSLEKFKEGRGRRKLKKLLYFSLPFGLLFLAGMFTAYQTIVEADHPMKVIVDRLEGDYAVVELPDKTMVDMSLKLLAPRVKEGDVVEIRVLDAETRRKKNQVNQLMNDVFEK